jgi:predicted O-methyltransferase YrrM
MRLFHAVRHAVENALISVLALVLSPSAQKLLISKVAERNFDTLLEVFGPLFNRKPNLDSMPFDLPAGNPLQFENLAGLFASTSFDHAVIFMPIRQAAYMFGFVRQTKPSKVVEIGRYKGGATLLLAAAMNGNGKLWSIDVGEKEERLHKAATMRNYDTQLRDRLQEFDIHNVEIVVGDSRTVELNDDEFDVVFIDGDHSYEGVKIDFERFGRRVRINGAVLFDDAAEEKPFLTHSDTVGRVVSEAVASGDFRLVKTVNRLAHLERIR